MIERMETAIAELEKMFDCINREFYSGELPRPIITIQTTPRAYGHCSTKKCWQAGKKEFYEINIGANTLGRKVENTVATLIHESVHLYCIEKGIKDTSGAYHNRIFKDLAEIRTLDITCDIKYGWTVTNPTKATKDFIKKYGLKKITLNKGKVLNVKEKGSDTEKKKSSTRKYICQKCGNSLRTTKDLNIMCMDCMVQFVKVD